MLRGRASTETTTAARTPVAAGPDRGEVAGVEQPYDTGERPAGVLFVRGPTSFWFPYHLLQGMRYEPGKLTLVFAAADVVIEGRGLHGLYLDLARQVVWRIVEQGARYAELSDGPTCVTQIVEIPKGDEARPADAVAGE